MRNNNFYNNKRRNEDKEYEKPYRDYAKGIISLDECFDIILERGDMSYALSQDLSEKLDNEFKNLCETMKRKRPEEIIDKAYELTVKEEIKEELKYMDLHDKEKLAMIMQPDLLNEFYHDWLDTDIPLGDVLTSTIEESIITLTKYANKNNKNYER